MFLPQRYIYSTLLFTFMSTAVFSQNSVLSEPQKDIIDIAHEQLFAVINKDQNTVYVVNFWATWCQPCVEELPDFMEVNKHFAKDENFKMYLVTLDFARKKKELVIPFIQKNDIRAEVLLLDDNKRMNTWISLIDKSWSGALPATLIYKNGKSLFFKEGNMDKNELITQISKHL